MTSSISRDEKATTSLDFQFLDIDVCIWFPSLETDGHQFQILVSISMQLRDQASENGLVSISNHFQTTTKWMLYFDRKKSVTNFDRFFDWLLKILTTSEILQKFKKFLIENNFFLTDRSKSVKEICSPLATCDRSVTITGKKCCPVLFVPDFPPFPHSSPHH